MDTDTLDLLSLTPQEAFKQFLASIAKSDLNVDQLAVLGISAGQGVQSSALVGIDLVPGAIAAWKYGGVTPITFNRLDLADVFTGSGITLHFYPPSWPCSTAWICNQIATIGQINFDPADFIQEEITQEMGLSYFLKAAPDSERWVGQVPVILFDQTPINKFLIDSNGNLVTNLGSMENITQDMGIGLLSIDTNGTILGSELVQYTAGTVFKSGAINAPSPWPLFNRVLSQSTWVLDGRGPKPNNGYGASVLYNGPIVPGYDTPFNTNLDHVCRIQLNMGYCSNTDGVLNLYYSLARVEN